MGAEMTTPCRVSRRGGELLALPPKSPLRTNSGTSLSLMLSLTCTVAVCHARVTQHQALSERLRGGFSGLLGSGDVLAHPARELDPRDVPKFYAAIHNSILPRRAAGQPQENKPDAPQLVPAQSDGQKTSPARGWGLGAIMRPRMPSFNFGLGWTRAGWTRQRPIEAEGDQTLQNVKDAAAHDGLSKGAKADVNSVCQTIVIEASVADCFAAATGFEEYPLWAGGIQDLRVLEPARNGQPATLVEWTMGMFGITTKNRMRYSFEVPGGGSAHRATMKWHVTEGGVKELVGRYEFVSLGPSKTKVIYNLFVEPGFPLPDMVKRATNRAVAKAALQDLKRFTESIHDRRTLCASAGRAAPGFPQHSSSATQQYSQNRGNAAQRSLTKSARYDSVSVELERQLHNDSGLQLVLSSPLLCH